MKYPRLAALRAQRERQEAEIAEPYLKSMLRARQEAAAERKAREGLERIVASKVAPQIFDHVSHAMAEGVERHIREAVAKVYPTGGIVQLEFIEDQLRWGDPSTIARRVVDEYKRQCGPKMRFRALASVEDMTRGCTSVQVSIPELHYRLPVMDEKVW